MRGSLLCVSLLPPSAAAITDLQRTRAKIPRQDYKGRFAHDMGKTLNAHLARSHPKTKPCHEWTSAELQQFQAEVFARREPAHDRVYNDAGDSRALRMATLDEHRAHWAGVGRAAAGGNARVAEMQRDGHCHEAVMWWVHHLSHDTRAALRNTTAPQLPLQTWRKPVDEEGAAADTVYHKHYHPSSTCQACHLGGLQWMESEAADDTREPPPYPRQVNGKDRERRCDEYFGDAEGGRCKPCEGISGAMWGDLPDEGMYPACENVAGPDDVPHHERVTTKWPAKFAVYMRGADRWPRETPSGNASCGFTTDCSRKAHPWPSPEQGNHQAGSTPAFDYHWYATIHSILYVDKREGHLGSGGILRHETAYEFPNERAGAERSLTGRYGEENHHMSQVHMQTRQQAEREPCPPDFAYGPCANGNPGPMMNLQHRWINELNKSGVDDSLHVDWRRPDTKARDSCTCLPDPVGLPDFVNAFHNATYLGRARFVPPWTKTFGPNAGGPPDGVPVTTDVWVKWSFHLYMDIDPEHGHYPAMFSSPFGGTATYGNWTLDPDAMWPESYHGGWRQNPESDPLTLSLCINPQSYGDCPKAFPWSPTSLKTPVPAHRPHPPQ